MNVHEDVLKNGYILFLQATHGGTSFIFGAALPYTWWDLLRLSSALCAGVRLYRWSWSFCPQGLARRLWQSFLWGHRQSFESTFGRDQHLSKLLLLSCRRWKVKKMSWFKIHQYVRRCRAFWLLWESLPDVFNTTVNSKQIIKKVAKLAYSTSHSINSLKFCLKHTSIL